MSDQDLVDHQAISGIAEEAGFVQRFDQHRRRSLVAASHLIAGLKAVFPFERLLRADGITRLFEEVTQPRGVPDCNAKLVGRCRTPQRKTRETNQHGKKAE